MECSILKKHLVYWMEVILLWPPSVGLMRRLPRLSIVDQPFQGLHGFFSISLIHVPRPFFSANCSLPTVL